MHCASGWTCLVFTPSTPRIVHDARGMLTRAIAMLQVPFKDVFKMAKPFGYAADGVTPLPLDPNGYVTSIPHNVTGSPKVHILPKLPRLVCRNFTFLREFLGVS